MDKHRVLFVVHTYFPAQNGVQAVTQYMAEGLEKAGNTVAVVTGQKRVLVERETVNNVDVFRIFVHRKRDWYYEGDTEKLYQFVDEYSPDVVFIVGTQIWPFEWMLPKLATMNCKKVLCTHGYPHYQEQVVLWRYLFKGRIRTFFNIFKHRIYFMQLPAKLKMFDAITYLTESDCSYQFALKHHLNNGFVLENAVEDVFWGINRSASTDEKDSVCFFHAGSYCMRKNQLQILEAFYVANIPSARLVFVGSDKNEYYNLLCQKKGEMDAVYGIKDVVFEVGISRDAVIDLYKDADVFVMASKWEGFSISLCEAAASAIPIISTSVGNAVEFDGVLLADSIEDISKQMRFLAYHQDERRERGKKLRSYAEIHCKADEKVKRLIEIID